MPNLCIIPSSALTLLREGKITPTDIVVLCSIGEHTDKNGEGSWASSRTHMEKSGIGRSTFFSCTKRLIENGLVERDSGQLRGEESDYRVIVPMRESRRRDTPVQPHGRGESSQVDSPTINAPVNDPSSSPPEMMFTAGLVVPWQWPFRPDLEELLERVKTANGSSTAWCAEIKAALDGMHTPKRTLEEIGQAIRDFNASGADISLRLFRGYLRGNGSSAPESDSESKPGARNGRKLGYTLAAAELRDRLVAVSMLLPGQGKRSLMATWAGSFTPAEQRVIRAVGPGRILGDENEGTLISQLAKALEEANG